MKDFFAASMGSPVKPKFRQTKGQQKQNRKNNVDCKKTRDESKAQNGGETKKVGIGPRVAEMEAQEGSTSDPSVTMITNDRKKRGPTEMLTIQKYKKMGKKLVVLYNRKGEPMGKAAKKLASYTGVMARTTVPIRYESWPEVDKELKDIIWREVEVCYSVVLFFGSLVCL